jgi:hypothetical protein
MIDEDHKKKNLEKDFLIGKKYLEEDSYAL